MTTLNASEARANLYRIMEQISESHQPITITGKRANSVLVSENDWLAIQETLNLLSIPGYRESIKEGLETDIKDCSKDVDW